MMISLPMKSGLRRQQWYGIPSSISLIHNLALLLLVVAVSKVESFRTGTGSCEAGSEALLDVATGTSIHGQLNQVGTGPLGDFGLVMELDGQVLTPGTPTDFTYGIDHVMTLSSTSGNNFTGFLVRMESPTGVRTLDAIQPIVEEDPAGDDATVATTTGGVQVSFICQEVNRVAGVTHVDNSPRSQVKMALNMESPAAGLEVDVTVVIKTDPTSNVNEWYLSQYILNAVPEGGQGTPSPTAAEEPTTDAPSPAETDEPSNEAPAPASNANSNNNYNNNNIQFLWMIIATSTMLLLGMMTWSI